MSGSDSDSGPEDRNVPKKAKVEKRKATDDSSGSSKPNVKSDGKWELGSQRFVSVSQFKGRILVDIREFYVDRESGETKPGKKGISLNKDQLKKLRAVIDDVIEYADNA